MDFILQNAVDIGFIVILVITVAANARKGFVRTVLTLAALVLAFGFAEKAAEPVASWSYDAFVNKRVCEVIDENAAAFKTGQTTQQIVNEVVGLMPEYLNDKLTNQNIDLDKLQNQMDSVGDISGFSSQQISDSLVKPAAMILLKIICTLLCFVVFMLPLRLAIHFICKVVRLPVLRSADKALGGVLGFVKGIMFVYLLAMLFGLVGQVTAQPDVKQAIERSKIVTACQQTDFSGRFAELFDKNSTE